MLRARTALRIGAIALVVGVAVWLANRSPPPPDANPPPAERVDNEGSSRRRQVTADGDQLATGAAPNATEVAPVETESASEPPGPFVVRGTVVDAATDEPIAGASVLVVRSSAGGQTWWTVGTDEAGAFVAEIEEPSPEARLELWVKCGGYENWRGATTAGENVVRLTRSDRVPLAGRLVGHARTPTGKPFAGGFRIVAADEMLVMTGFLTASDEAGRFVLDGLAAGHWRFQTDGAREWSEAVVPEGGDGRVAVVVSPREERPGAPRDEQEFRTQLDTLSTKLQFLREDGAPAEAVETIQMEMVDLQMDWQARRPWRAVVIEGLGAHDGAVIRAQRNGGDQCITVVRDGVASFPALTCESWTLLVPSTGGADRRHTIVVLEGAGPLRVDSLRGP